MEQNVGQISPIGIALEVTSEIIQSAVTLNDIQIQKLAYFTLPQFFITKDRSQLPLPSSITDWLANIKLKQVDQLKISEPIRSSTYLMKIIKSVMEKTQEKLTGRIKYIVINVAASLLERDRSLLLKTISGLGYEVNLVNEDRAIMNVIADLNQKESLIIYNLRERTVDISRYQNYEGNQKIEQLEIVNGCGLSILDQKISQKIIEENRLSLSEGINYPYFWQAVRQARSQWLPEKPLSIQTNTLPQKNIELSSDQVRQIFEETFFPSFSALRKIITDPKKPVFSFIISPTPCSSYLIQRLQQTLGFECKPIGRESIINGLAVYAQKWNSQQGSINGLSMLAENVKAQQLPEQVFDPHSPWNREAGPDSIPQKNEEGFEQVLNRAVSAILTLIQQQPTDKLGQIVQKLESSFEEFEIKIWDKLAEVLVERGQFEEAIQIYGKFKKIKGNNESLIARAAGLCYFCAKKALKEGDTKKANNWCNRGLKIKSNQKDLRELKDKLRQL